MLANRVCIVTGGASGQGRAVAQAFARLGATVISTDMDQPALDEAAVTDNAEISGAGVIRPCVMNVATTDGWEAVTELCRTSGDRVDVLYNNAAVFLPSDRGLEDTTVETWDQVMAVNARGVFLGCKAVAPFMKRQKQGSIINVASIRAALGTYQPQDAYAASKGAVVALSRSLAVELGPWQIRCNVIAPGTIETPMLLTHSEQALHQRRVRYPAGRFGTVDDIVGLATYLASPASEWMTGAVLPMDGGASALYV